MLTADEIIEAKAKLTSVTAEQIKKYANFEVDDFMNPDARKVILYIDDVNANPNHPVLQTIRAMNNMHGIQVEIMIGSLNDLKNALK